MTKIVECDVCLAAIPYSSAVVNHANQLACWPSCPPVLNPDGTVYSIAGIVIGPADDTGRIETPNQPELLANTASTAQFWNSFFSSIARAQALPPTPRETQP